MRDLVIILTIIIPIALSAIAVYNMSIERK